MKQRTYLIDGVSVLKRVWERRKLWGEHVGARFEILEPPRSTK